MPLKRLSEEKRPKAKARHLYFTNEALANLKLEPTGAPKQYAAWDAWDPKRKRGRDPARGLCVVVTPKGAKTFYAVFYFRGSSKPIYMRLGPVGQVSIEDARRRTREARELAKPSDPDTTPQDPRDADPNRSGNFKALVDEYIKEEQKASEGNKSADATKAVILGNTGPLHARPVATINRPDIRRLLAGIRDGDENKGVRPRPAIANRLHSHLRSFFRWLVREEEIKRSPMADMPAPSAAKSRDRVFTDDEVKAIWQAADKLSATEGGYAQLMLLLGLRRNELAHARWSEFDDPSDPTLFTVPTERVKMKAKTKAKKKPVYRTPLPLAARRILRGLRRDGEDVVFPGLRPAGIKAKLVRAGAPDDFALHTCRHTITTFLENAGHDEFDRGLVLNHSSSGVTAGYSHGYGLDRKRALLEKWADHVHGLVDPEGFEAMRRERDDKVVDLQDRRDGPTKATA